MQKKMETAIFDKSVKERNKEWKGYANMDEFEKIQILEKIDSLDLSNNALLRLPKEVTECPNLKHINLLGNNDIDWQDCFTKIKATEITSIYISVNDLSDIDSTFWYLIIGIEILQNKLQAIPKNILQQEQLTYLDLSVDGFHQNNFSTLPKELFQLNNLQHLALNFCQIDSLPIEIGNLQNLIYLDLYYNKLTTLPPEIGNLQNLTYLAIYENKLTTLPPEIGNLQNLTELNLSSNELSSLPYEIVNLQNLTYLNLEGNQLTILSPEIGNLQNLTIIELTRNPITSEHIEEIKAWLPNSNVVFQSYQEYWYNQIRNNEKYKKITNYYLSQINDTTGLSPNDKEIYAKSFNNEGIILLNNNKQDSAFNYFIQAVEIKPDSYLGWYHIGRMYSNYKNNLDSAIICYEKAIEIDSTKADSWSYLGWAYWGKEQYEKAAECFEKTLKIEPYDADVWKYTAFMYRKNKEYEKSLTYYNKAIELKPSGKYYHSRAFSYIKLGKFAEAKADLEKAENSYPNNNWIYIYWACYYSLQKKYRKSIRKSTNCY